ncbi:penicillin amidase [Sediminicola sp. YIK13]|uniref:penicillin acylase family protein n=1 Tax=Sediminicola sp. YIK13 TaxID=1453352 RepID=UPI0007228512|nr:penicillin acylase family protein [Sediminicola sp. YIK13]ALM09148.1 penicillin amidase [Sediminicola sp. YIK13]
MNRTKKVLAIILLVLGVLALALIIFIQTLRPDYNGKKKLKGISESVSVYFDTYGIPHIYASNELDAIRALGYVHAQDRLWQMELLRRIGTGGLSEVFGKDMVGTDKFFLSLGIDDASAKAVTDLDKNSEVNQLAEAYLDGVNQFIEKGPTPVEFYLTGLQKKSFQVKDIYNTVGYMAFSFAMAHKTDPLLSNIKDKLGMSYLMDLGLGVNSDTEWIKIHKGNSSDSIQNKLVSLLENSLKGLPFPQFIGSNSWVLAPEKTKSGKVILANDPHIGFAQPSVWFEAHLSTPTYEKYGYHMAGIPFPILGHDRTLAYGITMFENDDIDFYYEKTHPSDSTLYKTNEGWEKYQVFSKTIKVKDGKDIAFRFQKSKHGPILNGIAEQVKGERPIAMSWIYSQEENKVLEAFNGLSHAKNIKEFQAALPNIHAPGLNIMYGDAQGNVAWWATAKLYQLPDSANTKFIMDGASGKHEVLRYLDFKENPQAINPPWHYVYSANNQPDSIAGMLYPGYYLPENRAKRIVQLLEPRSDWDMAATQNMMLDVTSAVDASIAMDLVKTMDLSQLSQDKIEVLELLGQWDGSYPLKSVEGTLYNRWVYFFLRNTLEDELGEEMFQQLLATHLIKRAIAPFAAKTTSVWWDNTFTKDKAETKEDIVRLAFDEAIASLKADLGEDSAQWTWDKVHTLEHGHPIGQVASLRRFFNVGPFPVIGAREVINNMGFPYDNTRFYKVNSGPSTRRIVDFSDIENSRSILPTGQSGNPFSPHYEDQAEMYINGEFRKMMMNELEIKKTSENILIFQPTKRKKSNN